MMGFRRAFRRVTRSIGRIGRSVGGSLSGVIGIKKSSDGGGDNNSYQERNLDHYQTLRNQFGELQNQYNQLNGQYQQLAQSNKNMTDQYGTLNNQFNQMMNQYKAMIEKNNGLQSTIDDKNKMLQNEQNRVRQEQLNRDAEKSKYDALNQAIGERGKFDQPQDESGGQGAGENSYGINQQNINFTGKVNPNGDVKDDDDVKRRLSRILQERGQMR